MGGVLGHLMEMGTEQHQGCGEGRTAAQHQGGAPGDGAAARGSGRLSGGQGQQGCGGGAGAESQPAEGFSQAAVAQSKGRSLIDVSQAATQQHQSKDRRGAAQSDQRHQQQAKQQGPVGPHRHPIPPTGEIDQGMGLAVVIDAGVGIKDIVSQVFPGQQQHRRQQKQQQLGLADRQPLAAAPAGRQQHRHDRHGIHRPLDGGLPEAPPLGPWIRHEGGGGQRLEPNHLSSPGASFGAKTGLSPASLPGWAWPRQQPYRGPCLAPGNRRKAAAVAAGDHWAPSLSRPGPGSPAGE